jgi:hypothetical protein
MKRTSWGLGLLVAIGCAGAADEPSVTSATSAAEAPAAEPPTTELGALSGALVASAEYCSINAGNCKGRCVQAMGCCIRAGVPREECVAERDACIADCEPPEPPPPGECHLPDCPF